MYFCSVLYIEKPNLILIIFVFFRIRVFNFRTQTLIIRIVWYRVHVLYTEKIKIIQKFDIISNIPPILIQTKL